MCELCINEAVADATEEWWRQVHPIRREKCAYCGGCLGRHKALRIQEQIGIESIPEGATSFTLPQQVRYDVPEE